MLRRYRLSARDRQNRALDPVRRRLAITLMKLARGYGNLETDACFTDLRISQTELADMLSVSRQTVSKELRRLRDEGVLGRSGGYNCIALRDIPGLQRIAEDD